MTTGLDLPLSAMVAKNKEMVKKILGFYKDGLTLFAGKQLLYLEKVVYYFSSNGSDVEVHDVRGKKEFLRVYEPSDKIRKRLETETPAEVQFCFPKNVILRVRGRWFG